MVDLLRRPEFDEALLLRYRTPGYSTPTSRVEENDFGPKVSSSEFSGLSSCAARAWTDGQARSRAGPGGAHSAIQPCCARRGRQRAASRFPGRPERPHRWLEERNRGSGDTVLSPTFTTISLAPHVRRAEPERLGRSKAGLDCHRPCDRPRPTIRTGGIGGAQPRHSAEHCRTRDARTGEPHDLCFTGDRPAGPGYSISGLAAARNRWRRSSNSASRK